MLQLKNMSFEPNVITKSDIPKNYNDRRGDKRKK